MDWSGAVEKTSATQGSRLEFPNPFPYSPLPLFLPPPLPSSSAGALGEASPSSLLSPLPLPAPTVHRSILLFSLLCPLEHSLPLFLQLLSNLVKKLMEQIALCHSMSKKLIHVCLFFYTILPVFSAELGPDLSFNMGQLLLYNRAEFKTSDHR